MSKHIHIHMLFKNCPSLICLFASSFTFFAFHLFDLLTSGIGSDRSTNSATTAAQFENIISTKVDKERYCTYQNKTKNCGSAHHMCSLYRCDVTSIGHHWASHTHVKVN